MLMRYKKSKEREVEKGKSLLQCSTLSFHFYITLCPKLPLFRRHFGLFLNSSRRRRSGHSPTQSDSWAFTSFGSVRERERGFRASKYDHGCRHAQLWCDWPFRKTEQQPNAPPRQSHTKKETHYKANLTEKTFFWRKNCFFSDKKSSWRRTRWGEERQRGWKEERLKRREVKKKRGRRLLSRGRHANWLQL